MLKVIPGKENLVKKKVRAGSGRGGENIRKAKIVTEVEESRFLSGGGRKKFY